MPVADPQTYARMLDAAREGSTPTRGSTSPRPQTVNAALRGFAEAGSDGLIQVSTGRGEFASGTQVKNAAIGAIALAEFIRSDRGELRRQRRRHDGSPPARQTRLVPPPAPRGLARPHRPRRLSALPAPYVLWLRARARREHGDREGAPRGVRRRPRLDLEDDAEFGALREEPLAIAMFSSSGSWSRRTCGAGRAGPRRGRCARARPRGAGGGTSRPCRAGSDPS